MWRAFFLAVGITLCFAGVACLGLERVVLKVHEQPAAAETDFFGFQSATPSPGPAKTIVIRQYTPWSFLALGVVVILYAYDLPRRING